MGSTRARLPKNFDLDERIERYGRAIEPEPARFAGCWAEACYPLGASADGRFARVELDLGCGKGSYLVKAAESAPGTLFLGMDAQAVCVVYAAQRVCEGGLANALVIPGRAETIGRTFAPGELDAITLNFPTPHPRKREAGQRLTTVDNLLAYREVLKDGGELTLRTDSEPLFDYSLPQLEAAGFVLVWTSHDTRAEHPEIACSEYEERLAAEGARVHGVRARKLGVPDEARIEAARAMPASLYDYIPDDLYEGAYIPHGMAYAIQAFRNRRDNLRRRAGATLGTEVPPGLRTSAPEREPRP